MLNNQKQHQPGIGRTFITTSVSYDKHVDKVGGGLGVLVLNDRSGDGNIQLNLEEDKYSINIGKTDEKKSLCKILT